MKKTIMLMAVSLFDLYAASDTAPAEIRIGQCAALTGPAAGLGNGIKAGMQAAFAEVNSKGGVAGRKLLLISADDGYEPEKSVDCTAKMVEDPSVFALAGFVGTPTAKVAAPIVQESKVPLVGLFTGAMLLRQPVQRYVLNIRASYDDETESLVDYLTAKRNRKRIAVFYQNDSFGLAGLEGTEKAMAKRNLQLAGKGSFERNTLAVKSALAAIIAVKPDAIVMVGPYLPTAQFVKEARAAGVDATFATISFVGTENLISELKAESEGLIISQVVPSPHDNSLPLAKAYRAALKSADVKLEPSYVSFEGYVNARVLIEGLERAGKELNREKLIESIESMKDFNIEGMKFSFSATSHQGSASVYLTIVKEAKAEPI